MAHQTTIENLSGQTIETFRVEENKDGYTTCVIIDLKDGRQIILNTEWHMSHDMHIIPTIQIG